LNENRYARILGSMRKMVHVACMVVLAACSGSSGGGNDAGPKGVACTPSPKACPDGCNPCTRLSDAQVAAVVGQTVPGQWNGDVCAWDYTDAQGDPSFEVALHVNTDYLTFQDLCHSGSDPDAGITITPVAGVGDDACYLTTPFGALGSFDLDFLKGCDAYSISIAGPAGKSPPFTDAMVQGFEKALALDAVANL
jgi:hypothetical protein